MPGGVRPGGCEDPPPSNTVLTMGLERFRLREGESRRTLVIGATLSTMISLAVFWQLFRGGGFTDPGEPLNGAYVFAGCAGASLALAALLNWRALARAVVAFPVVALLSLALLSFLSSLWTTVPEVEAFRYGLLIFGYAAVCIAAAVLVHRFGPAPLVVLVAVTAVVAAGMGLWAFAFFQNPMSYVSEFVQVPAGPFLYRNALALVAAAAVLPLMAGAIPRARDPLGIAVTVVTGLGLGVVTLVIALANSDFGILLAGAVLVFALVWPERILMADRQRTIGITITVLLIGLAGHLVFSEPFLQQADAGVTRMLATLFLVAVTPAVAWLASLIASRIPDRAARGVVGATVMAGLVLAALVVLAGPYAGSSKDLTQARRSYYEVTIETARLEPLKGTGPGSFQGSSDQIQRERLSTQSRFAHTIPGEMWVELGLAGLVWSLLLYVAAFRASWWAFGAPFAALLIPLAVGFLLNGLIDWNWHFPAITALWAIALGGLTGVRIADRPTPVPKPRAETSLSS